MQTRGYRSSRRPMRGYCIMKQSGYVEGQNLAIEHRWANNENDRLLVRRQVALIVAAGGPDSALAAKGLCP
jgi:hypothetical protein